MKESGSPIPFWDYFVERRVRIYNLTTKNCFNLRGSNQYTLLLQRKVTLVTYASLHVNSPVSYHFIETYLVERLVQQQERAMKCVNGF